MYHKPIYDDLKPRLKGSLRPSDGVIHFLVSSRIQRDFSAGSHAPVRRALHEALANSLFNADWFAQEGIVIHHQGPSFRFSNPGGFRVAPDTAARGSVSDPRNAALTRMFSLIGVGQGAGGGLSGIFTVWQEQGWDVPAIEESFSPDRITLRLTMGPADHSSQEYRSASGTAAARSARRTAVIDFLTEHITASTTEIAQLLGMEPRSARRLLSGIVQDGILVLQGSSRNTRYRLKA